jgi:hypothetical protein
VLIDATLEHDDFSANPHVSHQEDEKKEEVSVTSDRMQVEDSGSKNDLVFLNVLVNIFFYSFSYFFLFSFWESGKQFCWLEIVISARFN